MEIDKTTLADLVIFDRDDEFSIFNAINFTISIRGRDQLQKNLLQPLPNIFQIEQVQKTIALIIKKDAEFTKLISNGTLMVIERFYDANIDAIPNKATKLDALSYKLLHSHDFSLVKYSTKHAFDFLKGMNNTIDLLLSDETPELLRVILLDAQKILTRETLQVLKIKNIFKELSLTEILQLAFFVRNKFKRQMFELIQIFAKIDAWRSMGIAQQHFNLNTPIFTTTNKPYLKAEKLFHLLVKQPVPYNVLLDERKNFLFLTGANMAGKSTFIKACGTAVYLAHTGLGVPATNMTLSFFDGILSNINVIDNIAKGESYFFNEVQRIKATVQKINDGKNWLILIDELFKGTNVQDAMKCSQTVIEGLLKNKKSIFILSTHLYEIGEALIKHNNICFNYFETTVQNEQLSFSYTLQEGISNDRLGYLILKREGVVKMLEEI
jgi:DNA mismatch repair protein MutS